MKPKEMECMQVWINTYSFSYDLVIYLFELYKGKNIVYLHKIATEWFQHEVYTVTQAKRYIYNKSYTAKVVLDAFGLGDRDLADMELIYIEKWSLILKMPDDLIRIACQRTIQHIHKASFAYADSILVDWNQEHVKTEKDLDVLDDKYNTAIKKAYKNVASKKDNFAGRKNFFNFQQRDYDYAELERILLNQKKEL